MYKLFMALRYLRSHRVIYFSIAGVAVGIMVMIIVTSVMGGFSRDIRARIRGMQSHLVIKGFSGEVMPEYQEILARVRKTPGVAHASPRIEHYAWLGRYGRETDVVIIGIDPAEEGEDSDLAKFFRRVDRRGEIGKQKFNFEYDDGSARELPGVVAGSEMRRRFAPKGSEIGLTTVRRSGASTRICNGNFEVVGSFMSGMSEYDQKFLFMNLPDAQKFLKFWEPPHQPPSINYVAVTVNDYAREGEIVKKRLLDVMHEFRPCSYPESHRIGQCGFFVVQTWEDVKRNLLNAVAIEKGIQIVILFCIVLVAGFNIVAIYTLMVKAKVREIGILRALGANRLGVAKIFLYSGLLCGLAGSFFGITVGLKASYNLSNIADAIEQGSIDLGEYAQMRPETEIKPTAIRAAAWAAGVAVLLGGLVAFSASMRRKQNLLRIRAYVLGTVTMLVLLAAAYGLIVNAQRLMSDAAHLKTVVGWLGSVFLLGIPVMLIAYWMALARSVREIGAEMNPAAWVPLRWVGRTMAWLALAAPVMAVSGLFDYADVGEKLVGEMLFNIIAAPVFVLLAHAAAKNWEEQAAPTFVVGLLAAVAGLLALPLYGFFIKPYVISLFPKDIYYLDRIPCEVSYPTIALIVGMTLTVSILASLYPAYRAANYDPVEAIRRE